MGAGMNHAAPLRRIVRETDVDRILLAGRYTLLDRSGLSLLDLCFERGVSVIAGGVFNSGVLADPRPGATFDYAPASTEVVELARSIGHICSEQGVPLTAAAVQFPARHPAVETVLVGARSAREVRANADAFECQRNSGMSWTDRSSPTNWTVRPSGAAVDASRARARRRAPARRARAWGDSADAFRGVLDMLGSRRCRRESERQRLAVRTRVESVRRVDRLLEGDRHRVHALGAGVGQQRRGALAPPTGANAPVPALTCSACGST